MLRQKNGALCAGGGEREKRHNERDNQLKIDSETDTERERENIEIWDVTLSIRLAGHQSSSGFSSQMGKWL